MAAPPALEFIGIDELGERPHVVVDGAPRPGTVLALTHWPTTPTPRRLWHDLSAEIAFAYLADPGVWVDGVDAVTTTGLEPGASGCEYWRYDF